MIHNQLPNFDRQIRHGWILLAAGLLCLLLGILLKIFFPQIALNPRVIIAIGILFSGLAGGQLARSIALKKNPTAAKRVLIEAQDERIQEIRQRAGNKTFELTTLVSGVALLVYSFISHASANPAELDVLWLYLALMVLGPAAVYVFCLVRYQDRY